MLKKQFIVGDVHGCFNELMMLIKKAKCDLNNHQVVLLGDVINKGPDSFKVLSWVRENNIEVIKGNHELKFIENAKKPNNLSPELKLLLKDMGDEWEDWLSWINSWPVYIEKEDVLLVHGGVVPGEHPSQSKVEHLVNIRYWDGSGQNMKDSSYPAWHDLYTGSKLVVYAHWATQGLKIKNNSIGLDTGCVYGRELTGIWLPKKELVQVSKS